MKYLSKTISFLKFIPLIIAVFVLSYCNSSTKVASSFGKRKYTTGHISHPVLKLKTEYNTGDVNDNIAFLPNTETEKVNFTATNSNTVSIPSNTSKTTSVNQANTRGMAITKGATGSSTNNVSLKENSVSQPDRFQQDSKPVPNSKASSFLTGWLVCLGIAIICSLLLIGSSSAFGATGAGAGCVLLLIGTFAFLAAIVLFILWVVALSKGV